MRFNSIARINFTIVAVCVAAVLFANLIGVIPDERQAIVDTRIQLCQTLASNISFLVSESEFDQIGVQLESFAKRNDALVSAGLRRNDQMVVASVGSHLESWQAGVTNQNDGCYTVPILSDGLSWGELEIQFQPLFSGTRFWLSSTVISLLSILVPMIGLTAWIHLSRILKYLDPSRAVPPRVRQTLDSFAEGVVLLDTNQRIVLANDAFGRLFESQVDTLIGTRMDGLPWVSTDGTNASLPWQSTSITFETVTAQTVSLVLPDDLKKIFSVNSSPVLDEQGSFQGVMVAFADVTPLEQKRAELALTLEQLHQSKNEISKQNEELRFLAMRDPLTGCLNRRTFFQQFETLFTHAKSERSHLSVMMVDIDFFKSINDNYGHSVGDEVLRETGALLNEMTREEDFVCRYGGEEFSVLMPAQTLHDAEQTAEAIRVALSRLEFSDFTITASIGLSEAGLKAGSPQDLLDQADKCLYVAKRNGRNQVVRFDSVPEGIEVDESKISRTKPTAGETHSASIPYSAVTALLSALSYRDAQTGAHSTRVAAYAALLAQEYLGPRDVYVVEIAGLLHDIGKIGVPDAILLKPGRLTKEEWSIMERHDLIGVEIINKAFEHQDLTNIVRHHHTRFDDVKSAAQNGTSIPIGARILAIADSFDAMVSDRPYRKGMPTTEALQELRRCAGTQFDPELVEQFAELIESGDGYQQVKGEGASYEVMLTIAEQIGRIADAADIGDSETFLALTDRLRQTAEQSNLQEVAEVAARAHQAAGEDAQLVTLIRESFELLSVCRSLRAHMVCDSADTSTLLELPVADTDTDAQPEKPASI